MHDKISDENIQRILDEFNYAGRFIGLAPYGAGHINDTFLIEFDTPKTYYILQRINSGIFQNVPALMRNFELVTDFLGKKCLAAGVDPKRGALTLIYTRSGKSYVKLKDEYFRSFVFIDRATAHQSVEKPEHFFEAGRAFGRFAALLGEFDASQLFESIPNFHDTAKRYATFIRTLESDTQKRVAGVADEIAFTLARKAITKKVVDLLSKNELPLRVTHNDTKLNNVMIDDESGEGIAVIDLDTVMAGSLLYDFGDSIRSGCNTGAEDEKNLSLVHFDLGLFESYARGYLKEVGGFITQKERELLTFAPILMTFECGMRFLTDYLDGDRYFKTKYPEHNLDRARTQYKLVAEMEQRTEDMKRILEECF
ncbi:MAG: aminoglycoside phosphotransferase family protein [Clostridiales bacterium]|jgi:hypothetical protein|nr:aminoglycoside phosphotransferase family protein [Clostridiales bacterium]